VPHHRRGARGFGRCETLIRGRLAGMVIMSTSEQEHAIRQYARKHNFRHHTVRRCSILRFAAIRAYRQEILFRAAQRAI
jgi:hypothetical protein